MQIHETFYIVIFVMFISKTAYIVFLNNEMLQLYIIHSFLTCIVSNFYIYSNNQISDACWLFPVYFEQQQQKKKKRKPMIGVYIVYNFWRTALAQ